MKAISFADADAKHRLTRHGAFDANFDTAYVYEGDLAFAKNATGADVLRAFGFKKAPASPGLFVVAGKLTVDAGSISTPVSTSRWGSRCSVSSRPRRSGSR